MMPARETAEELPMRIVSFEVDGSPRLGVVSGDTVTDLAQTAPELPRDLTALLKRDGGLVAAATAAKSAPTTAIRAFASLKLLPPIVQPGKIPCLGLNYADHAAEGGHQKPTYPSLFMRCATSLVAHGAPIIRPNCSVQLDYEAELAVIIGRRGRHVSQADALRCVAGYACFNDASVRDYQRKTTQWTMGKNFDATGGFGPWFVSADELPPGGVGLAIRSRLNRRGDAEREHSRHALPGRGDDRDPHRGHDARARRRHRDRHARGRRPRAEAARVDEGRRRDRDRDRGRRRAPEPDPGRGLGPRLRHSLVIAARLTMSCMRFRPASVHCVTCSGGEPIGSSPCAISLSRTPGSFTALTVSALNRSTIAFGVPAGAPIAAQVRHSNPGTPASVIVGTSGSSGERLGLGTASARSLPALMCG